MFLVLDVIVVYVGKACTKLNIRSLFVDLRFL